MARQVTISEVAKLAGVHPSTVSRALNPATRSLVNEKTARRVITAAESLNYFPNIMARGLRTRLSMTIGVIIPDLTNPIFPSIIRGIEGHLAPLGYTTLLADVDGSNALEDSAISSLVQRQVDGLIIATGVEQSSLVKTLSQSGLPVVLVNRGASETGYPLVTGDDDMGIRASVEHLHSLGHRNIIHIAGPQSFSTSRGRADAMKRACEDNSMQLRIVEASALTVEQGEKVTDALLAEPNRSFTALQASTDLLALGALRAIRKFGLSCPADISVSGFNDMPFAEEFSPGLTTVRVPLEEIGIESARQLMRAIKDGPGSPLVLTLPVSLVVRASTARVAI